MHRPCLWGSSIARRLTMRGETSPAARARCASTWGANPSEIETSDQPTMQTCCILRASSQTSRRKVTGLGRSHKRIYSQFEQPEQYGHNRNLVCFSKMVSHAIQVTTVYMETHDRVCLHLVVKQAPSRSSPHTARPSVSYRAARSRNA